MKSTNADGSAPSAAVSAPRLPTTDYVLLSQPTVLNPWVASEAPYGLHVRGAMTNHGFVPVSKVEGHGGLCAGGKDWLRFSDLTVHTAAETPVAPYLLGCASKSGFQPASRDVVMP